MNSKGISHSEPTNPAGPKGEGAPPRRKSLASQRGFWLVCTLIVGAIVFLPALRTPFLLDDYLQASMIEGTFPAKRGPTELYDFVNERDREVLKERGMLPWWSHPELQIRFFRPLSSLLRFAEHRVIGERPVLLHLHSFLWWALAVALARSLYRRALSSRALALATFVFAFAPSHAIPLSWLANREALLSFVFGAAGLGVYTRAREEGKTLFVLLSVALFSLALGCGEYALCFAGYVVAFELLARKRDGFFRRITSPLAFFAPAFSYLAYRKINGFGSYGSGFYTDPFREPVAFLKHAPGRFVSLFADVWFSLDDQTLDYQTSPLTLALVALVVIPLVAIAVQKTLAKLDVEQRSWASWMLCGSLLSLTPVLAVLPSPRLVGVSLLGAAPLVARVPERAFFHSTSQKVEPMPRRASAEITSVMAVLLGFFHLVHAPGTSFLITHRMRETAESFAVHAADLRSRLKDPTNAEVLVVRATAGPFFLPFAVGDRHAPPARWRILAHTGHALFLRRGPRTFDLIAPPEQCLFPAPGNLFRSLDHKLAVGDELTLPGLHAKVLEVDAQGPRIVRFNVDRDADAPTYTWITETKDGFPEVKLPEIGLGEPFHF